MLQIVSREYGPRAETWGSVLSSIGIFISVVAQILSATALLITIFPVSHLAAALISILLMAVYVMFGGVWGAGMGGVVKLILLYVSAIAGGVLVYGIPEFRLPKQKIVEREVEAVRRLGVEIETDVIVGRTVTVDSLLGEEGFDAVFIGSGAGLPRFMGIGGENLNGVVSANEFLTRANLMHAYDARYDTPIYVGQRVVVVGGGNVAMDAARCAKRLGAENVYIIYRRSEEEMPARNEEIHHAKEEEIIFKLLNNPVAIHGDEQGKVKQIECVEMELGEPDASGRRRPIEKKGSNFLLDVDCVVIAIGNSPNPLIRSTTEGLEANKKGCIIVDDNTLQTTREGVYAGGDAVTGAATVILAMGAGKHAAKSIDEYIQSKADQ